MNKAFFSSNKKIPDFTRRHQNYELVKPIEKINYVGDTCNKLIKIRK